MSFKDRARRVVEQGQKDRANYSPEEGSVPLRMYRYWASVRPDVVADRENFCHYWRVVAIRAPVWFILNKTRAVLEGRIGFAIAVAAVIALTVLGVFGGGDALFGAALGFGIFYTAIGMLIGAIYQASLFEGDTDDDPTGRMLMLIFTLPALLGRGLAYLVHSISNSKRAVNVLTVLGKGAVALVLTASVGLLIFGLIADTIGFLIGIAAVGVCIAVVFGLSVLGSFFKERHKASVEARTTYEEYDNGYYVETRAVVEPSRFAKFFIAIGDFLNLAFQVVRVKKWKICPIVEVPK